MNVLGDISQTTRHQAMREQSKCPTKITLSVPYNVDLLVSCWNPLQVHLNALLYRVLAPYFLLFDLKEQLFKLLRFFHMQEQFTKLYIYVRE